MMTPRKIDAILSLVPNAEVVIRGDEVEWYVPLEAPITDAQIDAELTRLQEQYIDTQQILDANKQNAIAKLTSLGLTADEVIALIGAK